MLYARRRLDAPNDPWPEARARARRLESLGYDHLWTYDHLSWRRYRDRPWHAAVPWLTGIAAATDRIRFGPMVASPNFRHPLTLAKEAMTLDHVSQGRVVLGLGAGGIGWDATVLGGPQPTPRDRADRLAEFVHVVDGLLRAPEYTHRGTYYTVDDARMIPGCIQRPRLPLAIAAEGPKTFALVAKYGDAWITLAPNAGEQAQRLDEACVAIGRDPATIERIYLVTNAGERPLRSAGAFAEFAERHAQLGFTDLVFHHPRADDEVWNDDDEVIDAIAIEVLPRLQRM